MSERCGGHVHIGADYLTTPQSWKNLMEIWGNTEKILYLISNKAGEIPRSGVPKYARPISGNFEEMLANGAIQLNSIDDLQKFAKESQINEAGAIDRYFGINFSNLGKGNNSTIEFRLANGTIDDQTWIENINLFGGIVQVAEKIALIQNKDINERNKEEQQLLENFERLKDTNITEYDKLESLLTIVIPEEDRDVYEERYRENSIILEQNPEVAEQIHGQIAKNPITINTLGRLIFTGDERITGPEYEQNVSIIKRELKKLKGDNIKE